MTRSLCLALCIAAAFSATARAQDAYGTRRSLAGLRDVQVVVEETPPELGSLGVTREALKTQVELRLRTLGINVMDASGPAFLHLAVALLVSGNGVASYSLSCGYVQGVRMDRDPSIRTFAATWWVPVSVVTVSTASLANAVSRDVTQAVDQFANDFRAANPPRR